MKRFVVLFLVLVLFIPVALSESNDVADVSWWDATKQQAVTEKLPIYKNKNYVYSVLPDDTIAILLYIGSETTVDISKSFPDQIVTSINPYAFYQGHYDHLKYDIDDVYYGINKTFTIKEVILPDTVTYLGNMFSGDQTHNKTIKFNIPTSLKYVAERGLNDANFSEVPYFGDDVIICGYNFQNLSAKTLTFPKEYKVIPEYWFAWLNAEKIIFSDGLEVIDGAFGACMYIKEISFPNTLKEIHDESFSICEKLTTVTLPGSLTYIGDKAFRDCPIVNLIFQEGTTSITTKAFSDREKLTALTLPTTLITIGERCFLRSGLTKLVIPANVTTIGEAAFKNSEKLKDITLPASLTSIADDAFDGCDPKAVFTVFTGTYAEQWANEHGYKTKVLVPVTEITLNEESATINKGKSLTLKATVGPKEATSKKVEWISIDPNVATVKDGKVQAKGCGSCDIICRAADGSGVQAVCHVSVIQMVSSLKVNPQKLTIPYGGTGEVEVTLKPEDATNKTLAWTSSDESICVVDENGKITAVGAGDCEIVCATTDGSNKSAKIKTHVPIFDTTEAEYTVTEKEGLLIPVDLHGVSVADITHKSSSDKYFLYYFDTEGLHIFPIAEGTAKITLTSNLNKQDKTIYNVTVAKSALYDTANGEVAPLNVIVTLDKSEMNRGESYTMKYHIIGGVPPYKINNALVDRTSYLGPPKGSTYSSNFTGLSGVSGTKQFKANDYAALYERITINVVDSAGQACTGTSNTIRFNTLQITTDEILFASPKDSSITVHYHIEGGSGKYKLNADWNVYWNSGQLNTFYTEKKNSSSEGEFTFTPPPDCAAVYLTIQAVDEKNSKNNLWFSTPKITMTDNQTVMLRFDNNNPRVGDNVTASIYSDGKKPATFEITKRTIMNAESLLGEQIDESTKLQPTTSENDTYNYEFTLEECEFIRVTFDAGTHCVYDIRVLPALPGTIGLNE